MTRDDEFDFDEGFAPSAISYPADQQKATEEADCGAVSTAEMVALKPLHVGALNEEALPQPFKNLFLFIDEYEPCQGGIHAAAKPFIPDYLPAFGDVDDFIKVPRPDDCPDHLGIEVLDEPCLKQSDPSILELKLRSFFASSASSDAPVRKLMLHDAQRTATINDWVHTVTEIHEQERLQSVIYQNPMPSVEALMEQWPDRMADVLSGTDLSIGKHMDMELEQLITLICALLQIPVFPSCVRDSLHVLFSLLIELQSNPYTHRDDMYR